MRAGPRPQSLLQLADGSLRDDLPQRQTQSPARQDPVHQRGERGHARAQSFLTDDHLERIVKAYKSFKDEPGFTRVATLEDIRAKDGNLSIPLYVAPATEARQDRAGYAVGGEGGLEKALADWLESSGKVRQALTVLLANSD